VKSENIVLGDKKIGCITEFSISSNSLKDTNSASVSHLPFEICYFKKGEGIYDIGGIKYPVKSGDIFLIFSGEKHEISDVYIDMNITLIWVNTQEIENLDSSLSFFLDKSIDFVEQGYNYINSESANYKTIVDIIDDMQKEIIKKDRGYSIIVTAQMQRLFALVMREVNSSFLKNPEASSSQKQIIENSIIYITDHITESLTLADLAKRACLNRSYYSTLFKKVTGLSPWDFILEQRIKLACKMIRTTSKNILRISDECGFNSLANFNKIFKKYTDITPSEYRKCAKQDKRRK